VIYILVKIKMAIDPRMLRNLNLPSLENLQARMNPMEQSAAPQGLLPSNQGVGSGLLGGVQRFAGRVGEAVAPVVPQAARNIADMARFTAMQRASMPSLVTAQDLDKLRPIDPVAIAAQLPTLRAAEEESLLKPETERMRQGLLQAQMEKEQMSLLGTRAKGNVVNIMLPDGSVTYGTSTESGNLLLPDGSEAPRGSRVFGTSLAATKIGDIAPKNVKAVKKFEELSSNAQTFFNSGNKLLRGLEENKSAATIVGTLSGVGSKIYQNVEAFGEALGVPKENLSNVENVFSQYSIDSAKMKSQILDLAYQAAAIRGQEGRGLSDRDIAIFSRIIGSNQSPEEKAAVLRDYMDTIYTEVRERAGILSGQSGTEFKVPELQIYRPQPSPTGNGGPVDEVYEEDANGNLVRVQ
jgi:hypothetical protein